MIGDKRGQRSGPARRICRCHSAAARQGEGMRGGQRGGFTLMEMLVALALFSVVVTITTDLFFVFQRTSRRTENLETVVTEARAAVETMAREIREGEIDYDFYVQSSDALARTPVQRTLALRNSAGVKIQFEFDEEKRALFIRRGATAETLHSAAVQIQDARFSILPTTDPFQFVTNPGSPRLGQFLADAQPQVRIFMALNSALAPDHPYFVKYDLQTTISNRQYRR